MPTSSKHHPTRSAAAARRLGRRLAVLLLAGMVSGCGGRVERTWQSIWPWGRSEPLIEPASPAPSPAPSESRPVATPPVRPKPPSAPVLLPPTPVRPEAKQQPQLKPEPPAPVDGSRRQAECKSELSRMRRAWNDFANGTYDDLETHSVLLTAAVRTGNDAKKACSGLDRDDVEFAILAFRGGIAFFRADFGHAREHMARARHHSFWTTGSSLQQLYDVLSLCETEATVWDDWRRAELLSLRGYRTPARERFQSLLPRAHCHALRLRIRHMINNLRPSVPLAWWPGQAGMQG